MKNTSKFMTSRFKKPANDNSKETSQEADLAHAAKHYNANTEGQKNSHISLWRAVIGQALLDATQPICLKKAAIQRKKSAIIWLLSHSKDFETVCHSALLEPSYVERIAKEALKSPENWYENAREQWRIVRKTAFGYADAHLHDLLKNNETQKAANDTKKNEKNSTSKCS